MKEFPYADILHLPHHVSTTRPRMSAADRAAQFAPFAALDGHQAAIRETGRVTQQRRELEEDGKAALDQTLAQLRCRSGEAVRLRITFFQPDDRKEGGVYLTREGTLRRLDEEGRRLTLEDGEDIPLHNIWEMEVL